MLEGWKYYNHAVISVTSPNETVQVPKFDRSFWRNWGKYPLFARWTSDFDCGYETSWWYVIKDTSFDISKLNSKRRYEINKGKKNFEVRRINALDYSDELLSVHISALSEWPEKYRPIVNKKAFKENLKGWYNAIIYGGFDREDGRLCAYSYLTEYIEYVEFSVLRARPESEKKGINAAMVVAIVEDYNDKLGSKFYINDGARAIRHETAFQDYLEKYFGFRKAYCKLNIKYRPAFALLINALYPFRNHITDKSSIGSKMSAVLRMEELRR